jgi:hypothetical protein
MPDKELALARKRRNKFEKLKEARMTKARKKSAAFFGRVEHA